MKPRVNEDVVPLSRPTTRWLPEPVIEPRGPADEDRWLGIAQLVAYSGLSARTVRRHLADPVRPIPHYRVGGRILIRRSEFDEWVIAVGSSPHGGRSTSANASAATDASWVRRLVEKE